LMKKMQLKMAVISKVLWKFEDVVKAVRNYGRLKEERRFTKEQAAAKMEI